jgi:excisionase family DNA binding protein
LKLALDLSAETLDVLADLVAERLADRLEAAVPSPYLTIPEAADYLRCKRHRLDDLLSAGRLTRHKEGSRTLIDRRELEQHVRKETR